MALNRLDRRVTLLQPVVTLDDYGRETVSYIEIATVWASRQDLSDGERMAAGQEQSSRTTRFTIRDSDTARAVTPQYRLRHEGDDYHVAHPKEALGEDRRRYIEITAGKIDAPTG